MKSMFLLLLATMLLSCATPQTASTSPPQVTPVLAAGGTVSVGSGMLGILSGNPFGVAKGLFDLFTATNAFERAVTKEVR